MLKSHTKAIILEFFVHFSAERVGRSGHNRRCERQCLPVRSLAEPMGLGAGHLAA